MARGLNKVQIIGNLGADPEMRYTPSGTAVTNFRVAVSRRVRGADGNFNDETEWFRVVTWDKLAETCNEYLRRGQSVYVEGRLQTRKYLDKENIERTSVEIVANEMIMLGGRGDAAGEQGLAGAGAGGAGMESRGGGGARAVAPARSAAPSRQPQRGSNADDDPDTDIDELPF